MWTIFYTTLRDRKISTIVYVVSTVLLMWMYIALFPTMQQQAETFAQMMESYPKGFLDAFGMEDASAMFLHLENFLATEQYSFIWPIMSLFMLLGLAGNGLAGEVEKGTAEILLARPVSRLKIFFARYLAGVAILAAFVLLSSYSVIPLAAIHSIDVQPSHYAAISVISFFFGLAILSLGFLFSSLFSEKGKAYFVTGGIFIAMYVLKIVSGISDTFEWTKYVSFFHYFDANVALNDGVIQWGSIAVFLCVAACATAAGAWFWNKRDIAV